MTGQNTKSWRVKTTRGEITISLAYNQYGVPDKLFLVGSNRDARENAELQSIARLVNITLNILSRNGGNYERISEALKTPLYRTPQRTLTDLIAAALSDDEQALTRWNGHHED